MRPQTTTIPAASDDVRLAKALSSPIRIQALRILNDRVASPSEIADELGLPVANVAYHVGFLEKHGCVELAETRPARGAIQHFYRATRRPLIWPAAWAALPDSIRDDITAQWFHAATAEMVDAVTCHAIDSRTDRHLSLTSLRLDEQAWDEIRDDLNALLKRAISLQAEAQLRLADGHDGGPEVDSRLIMLHYDRVGTA